MNTLIPAKPLQKLLAVWLLWVLSPAYAQFENVPWQPLGPAGGEVKSLVASGLDIYAGGIGGNVFRSLDKGRSWTRVSDSLPQRTEMNDLKIIGVDLYAGTSNGVFLLRGGTAYWQGLNNWPRSALGGSNQLGPVVRAIAAVGEELYAGTDKQGLYVYAKNERIWQVVTGVDTTATVWDIAGNDVVALVATSKGVFRRQGGAWALDPAAPAGVRCFARKDANFYAGAGDGIYDLGAAAGSWTKLNQNLVIREVNRLIVNGTRLLAGTRENGKLYRSVNFTDWADWSGPGSGFARAGDITDVLEISDLTSEGVLLAANLVGVSRTGAAAPAWQPSNQGLINTQVNDVAVVNDTLYAAAAGAVFARQGEGTGWTAIRHNLRSNTLVNAVLKHQNRIYCATSTGVYYLPTPRDTSWVRFVDGMKDEEGHKTGYRLAAVGAHLFVLTQKGIYRSTNHQNWQLASAGLPGSFNDFERMVVSGGRIYVFHNVNPEKKYRIFRSDNLGASWTDVKAHNTFRTGLTAHQGALLASYSNDTARVRGIYRSANHGASWEKISDSRGYELTSNGESSLFSAATFSPMGDNKRSYERLNFSADGGVTWSVISNATLPQNLRVKALEATATHVYVATWEQGVWMLPLSQLYPPAVSTGEATGVTATTATLAGTAGARVFGSDFAFEYSQDPQLTGGVVRLTPPGTPKLGSNLALSQPLEGLQENTTYYYRLVGANVDNVSRQGAIRSFRTGSIARIAGVQKPDYPFIEAGAPAAAYPRVSVTLNPGFPPPTQVNLWIRGLRKAAFTKEPLSPEGNAFNVRLPAKYLDSLGLQYYFEMLPPPGYGPRDTTQPVTLAVRHPAGMTLGELNFSNKQYQLLAFPVVLDKPELTDVLGNELPPVKGAQDPARWRMVRYNKRSDPFENLSSSSPLEPGAGYFLATTDQVALPLNTGGGSTVALHPGMGKDYFPITLQPNDWTLIGNPFAWDVEWEHVRRFNGNPPWLSFWAFDNRKGQLLEPAKSTTLFKFGGGYVKNSSGQAQSLRIPSGSRTGRASADPRLEESMPLAVGFTLHAGGAALTYPGLGLHPLALPGADPYDLELPPGLGGMPVLRFVSGSAEPLTRSVLPAAGEGHTWEFTISGAEAAGPSVLAWQVRAEPGKQLWLHDLTSERKADMLAAGSYTFRGNGRFRVYYGPAGYIAGRLHPERNLVQAYPNPSRGNTTFRFTLPPGSDHYRVRLTLSDAQGRRLGPVLEGTYDSGFHEVEVPLGRLPAGAYFLEAACDGPSLHTVQHLTLIRQ